MEMLEVLMQDLRYVLRVLRKAWTFTAASIMTLAIGIGAVTAVFGLLNAVLLRPLPYKHPAQLVWVTEFFPKFNRSMVLTPEFVAWERQNHTFEKLGAFGISTKANLTGTERPERISVGHVTPNFFEVLGVNAILGQSFGTQLQHGAQEHVAVLSYKLWLDYFASDRGIIGQPVVLDGIPYTVTAVMGRGFVDPGSKDIGVWLPDAIPVGASHPGPSMGLVSVIGRLKLGLNSERATADLDVIARQMDNQYPLPWSSYHASAQPELTGLHAQLTRGIRPTLFILLGIVFLILVIICANLTNLFLARTVTRTGEMAIRAGLGASRSRLVRLALTEVAIVAIVGGVFGIAVASVGTSLLDFLIPNSLPSHIYLSARVFGFAMLCSLATGVIFGTIPAFSASRLGLSAALNKAGHVGELRRRRRLQRTFAVSQLALSLVLLVGAGLLVRSFVLMLRINPGFDAENVLTANVSLAPLSFYAPPRQAAFFYQVLNRIAAIPGVECAAATDEPLLSTFDSVGDGLQAEGQPELETEFGISSVSPDYFRVLRIQLLAGRFFSEEDAEGRPLVVILNHALARLLFRDREAIGQRVRLTSGNGSWATVVGVVADVRHDGLSSDISPEVFQSYLQSPSPSMNLMVRTSSHPTLSALAIKMAVQSVDNSQPVSDIETLDRRISQSLFQRRQWTLLVGVIAFVALIISGIGVYGVMAYSVAQRTHEIGVRMAVGAHPRHIFWLVLSEGLFISILGSGIGLFATFALTRVLSSFLYGVTASDALTLIVACFALSLATLLASYIPARRAVSVNPVIALRHE
jgi:putative ABC transport system permease protein